MTVDKLRRQINEVRENITRLEAQQLTEDVGTLLLTERELFANRSALSRLQDALEAAESAAEAADREKARAADLAQLADLENEHRNSQARSAHAVNLVAAATEKQMDVLIEEFQARKEIAEKHRHLYKKVHGNGPDEDMRELHVSPVPSADSLQGEKPYRAFGNVALGLFTAVHDRLNGEWPLKMVLALIGGATRRQASHEEARAAETPDMSTLTPAQRLVIQRRGNSGFDTLSSHSRMFDK